MTNVFLFLSPKLPLSRSQSKELAKLYFDLGKLFIAAVVLEPLLNKSFDIALLILVASGLISAMLFFSHGLTVLGEVDKYGK